MNITISLTRTISGGAQSFFWSIQPQNNWGKACSTSMSSCSTCSSSIDRSPFKTGATGTSGVTLVIESQPFVNVGSQLGISYGFLALYALIFGTVGGAVRNILLGNADRIM